MSNESPSRATRLLAFFKTAYAILDGSRRLAMNLVFLAIVVALAAVLLSPGGGKPGLKEKTALVMSLEGRVVEQKSGTAGERFLAEMSGDVERQTQLRDIAVAFEAAAKDGKIERVVLLLDDFQGAAPATLREVASAMEKFKASGKQIVVWGTSYDQAAYYVAAHANEVYLHPLGMVLLRGFGNYRNYYKEALDRIGVSANVIRAGKYKNFGEPYFATGPSPETLESDKYLYDDLWQRFTADIEKARKLPPGHVAAGIDGLTGALRAAGGDMARVALDGKLVTGLKTRDELRDMMIERGARDDMKKSFRQVAYQEYLKSLKAPFPSLSPAIAIVVAEGEVSDGNAPAGHVGGRSTSELIRKARDDDKIKAILLRVNSPGGSVVGSELIRRELELARQGGKPVVVSMGGVAASGGYWMSMAADEVLADPSTITGSIGVFGMLPTGEKTMEKLSIHTGGYATTWLGEAMYDPRRPLDPRMAELVQLGIDRIYTDFTTRAATFRKTTRDKIDAVGQGRVWTGAQAKERGLIDRLGNLADAVKAAAARAKLGDDARTIYMEPERSKLEQFLEGFSSGAAKAFAAALSAEDGLRSAWRTPLAKEAVRDMAWLNEIAANARTGWPHAIVAHCLCSPTP